MPIPESLPIAAGSRVRHRTYGDGEVRLDDGPVLIVRFVQETVSVARTELEQILSIEQRLAFGQRDAALAVAARAQALAIRSLNDEWGVFAASRIDLLPHQLWVCRQVTGQWPTRWLIADDVGLGKTIEAGMIMSALLTRGHVRRMLILCPANLVAQWQRRMLDMFDIRLATYSSAADTPKSEFWRVHDNVVASFHTLRADHKGRRERLLSSEPFDLVVVDEAHHLNDDEDTGPTRAYNLLREMEDGGRIRSMMFFTGTPHRGKDFNFFALLELLRSDLFSQLHDRASQLAALPEVMIRNNKANATDLQGNRLFQPLKVRSEAYRYSPEEARFYELMTDFVVAGRVYAKSLNATNSTAVMLALVALQKLASSSVAAIRQALKRRLGRITGQAERIGNLKYLLEEMDRTGYSDGRDELESELLLEERDVALAQDEENTLRGLLAAADEITFETKIATILEAIESRFPERSILFFTEYKATQALLYAALRDKYGHGCVAFINGDGRLSGIPGPRYAESFLELTREKAAENFNEGKVRFLISTEAGGEGIDLQRNCHTLIHVDLPWNPMRLHQRVGRLNRYGQKHPVDVLMLHNPDTVESRIWELLNDKLERITSAVGQVMDDPEDMTQLVLGLESPQAFRDLFSGAVQYRRADRKQLEMWFDRKTSKIGGQDVATVVRDLIGNAAKFDYGQASALIPRVDLDEVRPFFENALVLRGRRVLRAEGGKGLSFRTPDDWRKGQPAIRAEYDYVTFDRGDVPKDGKLLGAGDPLLDTALERTMESKAQIGYVPYALLRDPLFIFQIFSRETLGVGGPRPHCVGVSVGQGTTTILDDEQLLRTLNGFTPLRTQHKAGDGAFPMSPVGTDRSLAALETARTTVEKALAAGSDQIRHRFRTPGFELTAMLLPGE